MKPDSRHFLAFAIFSAGILFATNLNRPVAEAATAENTSATATLPLGKPADIKAPLGLPPIPIPADNPPTAATVALGRKLYYDPILSVDRTVSCATCHAPEAGFSDRHPVSTGVGGKKGKRHAPTVINSAYSPVQFWDGRASSLEKQAEGPMANPVEMAHTLDGAVKNLQADPKYVEMFKKAWGTDKITIDMVTKSIASFERTVLSGDSPFDRYYYGHDKNALSASAQRGLKIFTDPKKGNCEVCHTIRDKYALFTDNKFHNLGVGADTRGNLADLGRYEQTKVEVDKGAFKTPTLRNIAERAPYMHDGTFPTLKDALAHYIGGGNQNPYLDKEIHALDFLTFDERDDVLAFLESLTGKLPDGVGPPADLPPGEEATCGKQAVSLNPQLKRAKCGACTSAVPTSYDKAPCGSHPPNRNGDSVSHWVDFVGTVPVRGRGIPGPTGAAGMVWGERAFR